MIDLVVSGGTVVDGTGAPGIPADVGVEDGRIVEIGDLRDAQPERRLDASGMIVAPGFIDIHSHSDYTLLVDPRAQSAVAQGVTTELVGNCGHGCAPITEPDRFTSNIYGYDPAVRIDWSTMAGYLDRLEAAGPAVNVATLVPNGNLRLAAMADPGATATPDEVRRMGMMLEEGLEAGAYGYSNGLEYALESAASEDETAELCRIVARAGALYATHERNKDILAAEAIEEGIRVARASGARLQISHIIPRRGSPPGSIERVVELVEEARGSGLDAAFDAHTRLHGILNASAALPAWALEGTPDDLRARLRDPEARGRMKQHRSIVSNLQVVGWDRLYLFTSWARPESGGQELRRACAARRRPVRRAARRHPGGGRGPAPLAHHLPRLRGGVAAPDLPAPALHHGVRRHRPLHRRPPRRHPVPGRVHVGGLVLQAVRARDRRLHRRGGRAQARRRPRRPHWADRQGRPSAPGAAADIVVFDPANFRETGTLEDPNHLAEGVRHVVVNGGVAIEGGSFTNHRSGQVLRRRVEPRKYLTRTVRLTMNPIRE